MAMMSRNVVRRDDVAKEKGRLLRNLEINVGDVKRIIDLTRDGKLGWSLDVEGLEAVAHTTSSGEEIKEQRKQEKNKNQLALLFDYYTPKGTLWEHLTIRVNGSMEFSVDARDSPKELRATVQELRDLLYSNSV